MSSSLFSCTWYRFYFLRVLLGQPACRYWRQIVLSHLSSWCRRIYPSPVVMDRRIGASEVIISYGHHGSSCFMVMQRTCSRLAMVGANNDPCMFRAEDRGAPLSITLALYGCPLPTAMVPLAFNGPAFIQLFYSQRSDATGFLERLETLLNCF